MPDVFRRRPTLTLICCLGAFAIALGASLVAYGRLRPARIDVGPIGPEIDGDRAFEVRVIAPSGATIQMQTTSDDRPTNTSTGGCSGLLGYAGSFTLRAHTGPGRRVSGDPTDPRNGRRYVFHRVPAGGESLPLRREEPVVLLDYTDDLDQRIVVTVTLR